MNYIKSDLIFNNKLFGLAEYEKFDINYGNTINSSSKLALLMNRTPELIFSIYKCLDEKTTYIPIDPTHPLERIQYIINDSNPDDIITDLNLNIQFKPNKQLPINEIQEWLIL